MKELIELQENSERQFSELMSKINEQKEYLTKEIEALIETKQELELELKNLVDEIKDEILLFVTTWMDLQSITLATKLQNARGSCLKIVKGKPYQVEWGRPCHWISCEYVIFFPPVSPRNMEVSIAVRNPLYFVALSSSAWP